MEEALTKGVKQLVRELDEQHEDEIDNRTPPICKVWGWAIVGITHKRLMAERFMNHPRLGTRMEKTGNTLLTSRIVWHSPELGMVRTCNTLYKLMPG